MEPSQVNSSSKKRQLVSEETNSTIKKVKIDKKNNGASFENINEKKIKDLPDDVLIEIIKLLPMGQWASLEIVNHQFQRAAIGAWRSVKEIRFGENGISDLLGWHDGQILRFLKPVFEKLALRAIHLTSIGGFCPRIPNRLYHRDEMIGDGDVNFLIKLNSLERISFANAQLSLIALANFLKTSASRGKLKELDLSMEEGMHSAQLLRSAFGEVPDSPSLISQKITFPDQQAMENDTFEFLEVVNVSKLTTLKFSATSANADNFILLLRRCTQLQHLEIIFSLLFMVDEHLQEVFNTVATLSSENLSVLKLRSSDSFGGKIIIKSALIRLISDLGRRFRLLELSLTGSDFGQINTSDVAMAILNNLVHLTSLEMEVVSVGGVNRGDASLLASMVTKLTQLDKLSFIGYEGLQIIDGGLVAAVATNLTNLKCLRLDYPFGKSDTFNCLSALGELKELRILRGTLSTKTMKAWNEFGGRLESLELPRCSVVCDKALINLIKNSHRLRRLNLEKTAITDIGLKAIAAACPLLSELDVSYCKKITLEGVQAVIDGCSMLKQVKTGMYREDNKKRLKTEKLKVEKYRQLKLDSFY